jgi:hypothetical protein
MEEEKNSKYKKILKNKIEKSERTIKKLDSKI